MPNTEDTEKEHIAPHDFFYSNCPPFWAFPLTKKLIFELACGPPRRRGIR
jgi:hypothetical protein